MAELRHTLAFGLGAAISLLGSLVFTASLGLFGYQCFMWLTTGSWPSYEVRLLWGSYQLVIGPPWFAEWLEQTPLSVWLFLLGPSLIVLGAKVTHDLQRPRR